MTQGGRRFITTFLLIIIIVLLVAFGAYFLFFRNTDPSLRVKDVGPRGIVDHRASEYKDSRLFINNNDTFEIELIQTVGETKTILFTGIGTFTKSGGTYTFTYIDSYQRVDDTMIQQSEQWSKDYTTGSRNRVQFEFDGNSFYFGK